MRASEHLLINRNIVTRENYIALSERLPIILSQRGDWWTKLREFFNILVCKDIPKEAHEQINLAKQLKATMGRMLDVEERGLMSGMTVYHRGKRRSGKIRKITSDFNLMVEVGSGKTQRWDPMCCNLVEKGKEAVACT